MNNRQRIINTVLGKEVDRLPVYIHFSMIPWKETYIRWEKENSIRESEWEKNLGLDSGFKQVNVNLGFCPCFEEKILEDRGNTLIFKDKYGIIQEQGKEFSSIPRYIEYPVKNRSDWEKLKVERLNADSPERFPSDWKELVKEYNEGDYAIQVGEYPYGLFGTLRDFMGVEKLLVTFYDDPDLIKDMMDHLTDMWIKIYTNICEKVKIDHIHIWEDMSGCQGSLISPKMVKEFMIPNYKKISAFAKQNGIEIFSVDTDGRVDELVPLFLEAGVNLIWPFEVAAGCDVVQYGIQYPKMCIMGGIDKREIGKGKEAIDKELERIAPMFKRGRYIPALDHAIPPEVSWDDFCYYIERLKEYIKN